MLLTECAKLIRGLGLTYSRRDAEIRVNFKDGAEATAYYTNDALDAYHAALDMAGRRIEQAKVKCPMCHGADQFCTLCNGALVVTVSQSNEFRRQNPDAL